MKRERTPRALATSVALLLSLSWAVMAQAQQTFSGRAFGALVGGVRHCDTGALAASGGVLANSQTSIQAGLLSTGQANSACNGAGASSTSSASLEAVVVTQALVQILTCNFVSAQTEATCVGVQGSSTITGLVFAGVAVSVTGQANQTVNVPGVGQLIINEQVVGQLSLAVNALHLILASGAELILCGCESGLTCTTAVEDGTWAQVKGLYR